MLTRGLSEEELAAIFVVKGLCENLCPPGGLLSFLQQMGSSDPGPTRRMVGLLAIVSARLLDAAAGVPKHKFRSLRDVISLFRLTLDAAAFCFLQEAHATYFLLLHVPGCKLVGHQLAALTILMATAARTFTQTQQPVQQADRCPASEARPTGRPAA